MIRDASVKPFSFKTARSSGLAQMADCTSDQSWLKPSTARTSTARAEARQAEPRFRQNDLVFLLRDEISAQTQPILARMPNANTDNANALLDRSMSTRLFIVSGCPTFFETVTNGLDNYHCVLFQLLLEVRINKEGSSTTSEQLRKPARAGRGPGKHGTAENRGGFGAW